MENNVNERSIRSSGGRRHDLNIDGWVELVLFGAVNLDVFVVVVLECIII